MAIEAFQESTLQQRLQEIFNRNGAVLHPVITPTPEGNRRNWLRIMDTLNKQMAPVSIPDTRSRWGIRADADLSGPLKANTLGEIPGQELIYIKGRRRGLDLPARLEDAVKIAELRKQKDDQEAGEAINKGRENKQANLVLTNAKSYTAEAPKSTSEQLKEAMTERIDNLKSKIGGWFGRGKERVQRVTSPQGFFASSYTRQAAFSY